MRLITELRERLRALLFRSREERELAEELRFHMEMETERLMREGVAPAESARRARVSFGGVERTKEGVRDARGMGVLEPVVRDARYAARSLRRSPGFAAIAVLILAVAIGANGALFGLVEAVLFRMPTGVPASDRLVRVESGSKIEELSYADYRDLAEAVSAEADLAASAPVAVALGSGGEEPVRVPAQLVAGDYFGVLGLGVRPGRAFLPEEVGPTAAPRPVVVLGHGLWERRFGGEAGVIGTSIVINGQPFMVVGIAAEGFVGTDLEETADLWVPAPVQPLAIPTLSNLLVSRRAMQFHVLARLRDGVAPEALQGALTAAAPAIEAVEPDRFAPLNPEVYPLRGWYRPQQLRSWLPAVAFAGVLTGLVLLVACANVANLLLARAVARRREMGIRVSLGAGRGRLVRLLLTEALMLSLVAGVSGVLFAFGAAAWFQGRFRGSLAPVDVSPDGTILAFSVLLASLTGLLFGLAPAWRASRPDVLPALRGDSPSWLRRTRLQGALVVAQVALSVVLLATAGLFLRKVEEAAGRDVGYDAERVLTAGFDLFAQGYSAEERKAFTRDLRSSLARLPGVTAVSVPTYLPFGRGAALFSASIPGRDPAGTSDSGDRSDIFIAMGVGPDHFRTLGIPLLAGRGFTERDMAAEDRIAVVSESFARRHWPGESALGKRFDYGRAWEGTVEVVGIARDIVFSDITGPREPHVYVPWSQHYVMAESWLAVRTETDPATLAPLLRREVALLDPHMPLFEVRTLSEIVADRLAFERRLTGVIASFGLVALLLATLGLYGVVAFTVSGRRREIGVRVALGARPREVTGIFVRDGLRLTAIGLLVGAVLALGVGRVLSGVFQGIRAADPPGLATVCVTLACAALLASVLPALRAARVEPTEALRAE